MPLSRMKLNEDESGRMTDEFVTLIFFMQLLIIG